MQANHKMGPLEQPTMKFKSECHTFILINYVWICRLSTDGQFAWDYMCYNVVGQKAASKLGEQR